MRGYRREHGKTAATIRADGWLRTGDIATIDDDGYVRIVDRKKGDHHQRDRQEHVAVARARRRLRERGCGQPGRPRRDRRLLTEEWLPGGEELTPTMKLKRKPIAEKYASLIERLYSD
jgi:long-chain acyl-CoA synthetase